MSKPREFKDCYEIMHGNPRTGFSVSQPGGVDLIEKAAADKLAEALEYVSKVEYSLKVYLGPEKFEELLGTGLGAHQALKEYRGEKPTEGREGGGL